MYSIRTKSPTSKMIPIPKPQNTNIETTEREHSNNFNPSKFSPPNEFLNKLQERLNNYSPPKMC